MDEDCCVPVGGPWSPSYDISYSPLQSAKDKEATRATGYPLTLVLDRLQESLPLLLT